MGVPGRHPGGLGSTDSAIEPSSPGYSSMAYDPGTGQLVLFGGFDNSTSNTNDVFWVIRGRGTEPRGPTEPGHQPAGPRLGVHGLRPRHGPTDPLRRHNTAGTAELTPGSGTAPPGPAPSRPPVPSGPGLCVHGLRPGHRPAGALWWHGYAGALSADTWTWNGTTWTQQTHQSPGTGPESRYVASMAFDSATGQLVLFGGADATGRWSE